MATTYRQTAPITYQRDVFPLPVTALAFDPVSDTLWTGLNSGIVTAYYTPQGMRGVTFPIGGGLAVKRIVASDSNVRAYGVASEGVGAWGKGGVNKWNHRANVSVTAMSCNTTSMFGIATATPELMILNSHTGSVVQRSPVSSVLTHLLYPSTHLVSGSSDGFLRLHDPRNVMWHDGGNSVRAHIGGIQGLEASGNYIYTIGLGTRQGRPYPDPLVKVYDIRALKPLPPLPFASGPAFINIIPKRPSTLAITSHQGLVNIVDASNPTVNEFYQLDAPSYITATAVSATGAYLAFGDTDGAVHLMSAAEEGASIPFNGFEGRPIEWADTPEPLPEIDWTDTTPLNIIGMPHYNEQLLSSWTPDFISNGLHYPPPPKIPQVILNTMKINDNVAYAALPKELRGRRNVAVTAPRRPGGRFRSGKGRQESELDTPIYEYDPDVIPRPYRKVEIEYSKFGVEDFDFAYYNRTDYSGLETHISNSYTNAMVQVMHYTLPIRKLAKSHIATDCPREHCLLCELGFVVRMLEDARGTNCQASNFCKTVGFLAQMNNAIELIDFGRETAELSYAHMIQSFHRFLVDHLSSEGNSFPHNPVLIPSPAMSPGLISPAPAPITQLVGIDAKNVITCSNCKAVREKENMTHVIDMIYPRKPLSNEPSVDPDFASLLRTSLLRPTTHKATCQTCKHFATFESKRSIRSRDLPPLLAVNAACHSEEAHKVWRDNRNQTFLKPSVELHGQLEGMEDPEGAIYDLRAMVVQVVTKDQGSHLVAIVKVPDTERTFDQDHDYSWYLLNDFVVRGIAEEEALSFPSNWKVPCVLYLERVDLVQRLDFSGLPTTIDRSILCRDTNIAMTRDKKYVKHKPLRPDELPKPGTLVAIDAEFVSMQQEETEFRSDGTKKVLRPARLSLARVSVLRGEGPSEGLPFIDDHIHTSEVIVDYLTEFSGIRFGDLDPHMTRYTLTPLKLVYKKLRLLVDLGCIFIGHGLSKDFRIINVFVPPEQVIDTVDLYFLPSRQRRLSLRFLAWFVLGENIQTDTHDSIEDALSALRLYKGYQTLESADTFDEKLDELYREGKKYNWRPPAPPTAVSSATPTMVGNVATQMAQMNMNGQQMMPPNMMNSRQSIMQTLMPGPTQFSGQHPMNMYHTPSPSPHPFSPPPWNR
ncbi:ubiquitin carboxyl-terminal hydrolase-domain-containing protein [Rhodofomes roseus]|uniref:PAN2-PAN3 deadenylation complex catalytic subunit PAN2 n=1 Tax=Rhodofomes roseus TaxID=34475 RepID=A0ABQ8KWH5_9APHY|nr:ubiquitin carboxyl-terminal hydrolase-domain-containing protein [Rhodofomes roseus]KAH9843028.1 ubiquitin carboxyl-terminal hydrolase-domain-containing protein [Rhodofomes roseus]